MNLKQTVSAAALGTMLLLGASPLAPQAQAGYLVSITQNGPSLRAIGGGQIDLSGLTFSQSFSAGAGLAPGAGAILTGPLAGPVDSYTLPDGPASFGHGSANPPEDGGGNLVGVLGLQRQLLVPQGYVSNGDLSSTSYYSGPDFTTILVTPGTYVWIWGTGPNQNFTLSVDNPGAVAVPEPASLVLLGMALAGLLAGARHRTRRET